MTLLNGEQLFFQYFSVVAIKIAYLYPVDCVMIIFTSVGGSFEKFMKIFRIHYQILFILISFISEINQRSLVNSFNNHSLKLIKNYGQIRRQIKQFPNLTLTPPNNLKNSRILTHSIGAEHQLYLTFHIHILILLHIDTGSKTTSLHHMMDFSLEHYFVGFR